MTVMYQSLVLLSKILHLFPLRWLCAFGRLGGRLAFVLDRRHRRLAIAHLRLAFPGKSPRELRTIARQFFIRLGEGAVEFLTYRNASLEYCLSHTEGIGTDIPHDVMKRGKGMIFLTAHYGNWELLGIFGFALMPQYEICAVGRNSGNKSMDRFVQEIREVSGLHILPKESALRNVIAHLRRGQVASFLADQIAGSDGVFVRFLDRSTWAVSTPARLSLKTGAPIVPVFIERTTPGHHRITYCQPLEPVRTGNEQDDVQRMTQEGMQRLEEFIQRRPDHWFWLHKRWKSKKAKKRFQDTYRIVVFSPHWIGDAVMSLPAQAALRSLFPDATIACAYPEGLEALYRGISLYDKKMGYGWSAQGFSMRDRWRLIRQLRAGSYDMAVLFPNSLDSALIAWAAGIRNRVGYAAHGRGVLLTCALAQEDSPAHQSQKYHRIIEALGVVVPQEMPKISISPANVRWVSAILGSANVPTRVAIHPGATYGPTKRWFPERFVGLAKELASRPGVQVVLLGSKKEQEALRPHLDGSSFPRIDAMGRTDLGKLMALIARMDLLVANDSGPMHLAGLLGIPTIAIFGSTDPQATAPLGPHRIVRKPISCSPCLKRTCANSLHPFECLDLVQASDVLVQIDATLPVVSSL